MDGIEQTKSGSGHLDARSQRRWMMGHLFGRGRPVVSVRLMLFAGLICWTAWGCTHTPRIYQTQPAKVEALRADIQTVGVVVGDYHARPEILRPAKGPLIGAGRGFVIGAAIPVAAGFVTPIPLGSLIGLMLSPVTAVAGSIYGAVTAVPAEEVARAQEAIEQAAANARVTGLKKDFLFNLMQYGSRHTGLNFVLLENIGPQSPEDQIAYDQLPLDGIDAILELRPERVGLRGLFTIDPPSSTFVEVQARLLRQNDNRVLFSEVVTCSSEEKRKYVDWAHYSGELIIDELSLCSIELSDKVIDDFFLVYPLKYK